MSADSSVVSMTPLPSRSTALKILMISLRKSPGPLLLTGDVGGVDMAAMVFDGSDQEPTCSPVKQWHVQLAPGKIMWAKNTGEKRIFWLKIFAKIENRATLAEDSDLRPWSATGAGGFEVLKANCKLEP